MQKIKFEKNKWNCLFKLTIKNKKNKIKRIQTLILFAKTGKLAIKKILDIKKKSFITFDKLKKKKE